MRRNSMEAISGARNKCTKNNNMITMIIATNSARTAEDQLRAEGASKALIDEGGARLPSSGGQNVGVQLHLQLLALPSRAPWLQKCCNAECVEEHEASVE
jgi:hypothetical protein